MGGGGSKFLSDIFSFLQIPKKETVDPKPEVNTDTARGLYISQSEGCDQCDLYIDTGISTSSARLSRLQGALRYDPSKPETAGPNSVNTSVVLKPSLPFKFRFNGVEETIGLMTVYSPSPLRIESVQHDAVIQIGWLLPGRFGPNRVIILVPLVTGNAGGAGGAFVQAFASSIPSLLGLPPPAEGAGEPFLDISTGKDWSLSNLISLKDPFFTWVDSEYEQYVKYDSLIERRIGWKPKDGVRYIFMQNPIQVSANDMAMFSRLPISDPLMVIPRLPKVYYKPGPPKNCITCVADTPVLKIPDITSPTATLSSNAPPGGVSIDTILMIVFGIIGGIALFIGIYFGVKFAMGPKGLVLSQIGESLGKSLAAAYAKAKARAAALPSRAPGRSILGRNAPTPIAEIADRPTALPDFSVTNPGYSDLEEFKRRHRTARNPRVPKEKPSTPELPDIFPDLNPTADLPFSMKNPGFKNRGEFAKAHRRTARNPTPGRIWGGPAAGTGLPIVDNPPANIPAADEPAPNIPAIDNTPVALSLSKPPAEPAPSRKRTPTNRLEFPTPYRRPIPNTPTNLPGIDNEPANLRLSRPPDEPAPTRKRTPTNRLSYDSPYKRPVSKSRGETPPSSRPRSESTSTPTETASSTSYSGTCGSTNTHVRKFKRDSSGSSSSAAYHPTTSAASILSNPPYCLRIRAQRPYHKVDLEQKISSALQSNFSSLDEMKAAGVKRPLWLSISPDLTAKLVSHGGGRRKTMH